MATYKNTDKIISHLTDEIEAYGNPDGNNEPITYGTMLGLLSAKAFIETAETADVQEVRHGRWKQAYNNYPKYVCSNCNYLFNNKSFKFCPNCGAKMDGKEA